MPDGGTGDGGDRSGGRSLGPRPYELEVERREVHGGDGGFLAVHRAFLRNRRPDGSRSAAWIYDYVDRGKGLDAVVLALWRRAGDGGVEVLLRDGLRPALSWGRPPERCALPNRRDYFLFTETVAGIIEQGEQGEEAVRRRAADEAYEEGGYRVPAEAVVLLGSGFPSPGMTAERFVFAAAEVTEAMHAGAPEGDGSPMEEGATTRWLGLDEAIAACVAGELEDAKTELGLRRLRDLLRGISHG